MAYPISVVQLDIDYAHPDLNREITEVGKRFIRIDTAYRKLVQMKTRYFHEKRA